jgi:hypothetical protein
LISGVSRERERERPFSKGLREGSLVLVSAVLRTCLNLSLVSCATK